MTSVRQPLRWSLPPETVTLVIVAIGLALGVRLMFWVVTDRVWEDALITLAHARNAREGLGLTHHAGEPTPVHGFTSALSVLIPLAGELAIPGGGLTTLRIASLMAAGVTVIAAFVLTRYFELSTWATAFVLSFVALNQNQIFYGMAGMETQVATSLAVATGAALAYRRERLVGVLVGLCVLARPELAMLATFVALWAFGGGRTRLVRVVVPAAVVLAPWLVFTTLYYGSPIPQTILAKGLVYSPIAELGADPLLWIAERLPQAVLAIVRAFMPFYEDGTVIAAPIDAGWLAVVGIASIGFTIAGMWISRRRAPWRPMLVYVGAFGFLWLFVLPLGYFTWYQPPVLALAAVLSGVGIEGLRRRAPTLGAGVTLVLIGAVAVHLPYSMPLDRLVQRDIENGVRVPTGRYLGEAVKPGEGVIVEGAGYVGYYSRATLWDFPGLTSRTSLATMNALSRRDRTLPAFVNALQAPWLVLRPEEWDGLQQGYPATAACYVIQNQFGRDRPPIVELNGLARWNPDWSYLVLSRVQQCAP